VRGVKSLFEKLEDITEVISKMQGQKSTFRACLYPHHEVMWEVARISFFFLDNTPYKFHKLQKLKRNFDSHVI
jgi:hypothetical protein